MKILICGAGAVGIFLGAKLTAGNHETYLFGRRKLKDAGSEVNIDNKKFEITRLFKLLKNEKYDFVFVTSKLYDLNKIVELIRKNKIKGKIVSNIQNGIVDCEKYEKEIHKKITPVCVFGGFRIEKNKIFSAQTKVGWLTEKTRDGKRVSELVSECGIKCRVNEDFEKFRAEKMIVNCCLNALSAVEKKPFNKLFSEKKSRERIEKLFNECYRVLSARYSLDKKEKMLDRMVENWKSVKHFSSTYQDLVSGRKSEARFFNGMIVDIGKEKGINTDENKRILEEIKEAEKKNGV